MEKKTARLIKWALIISSGFALLVFSIVFFITFLSSKTRMVTVNEYNPADTCLYHIVVTGTYENQSFLTDVYKGAAKYAPLYNSVVDLHVPQSQADTTSLQELLNYCTFLNADGIIAYIDSTENTPVLLTRKDEPRIPLITIGQFTANTPQISYIGTNSWELGKKIADETLRLSQTAEVYIINDSISINSSNLINSLQIALQENSDIQPMVIEKLTPDFSFTNPDTIFICLTEEDTIRSAQFLSEQFSEIPYRLIGFGGNEVCQLYLQKGYITELFSLDPEKIGEAAIRELFEYRHKGYANSYVTAEVKIQRSEK